MFFISPEMVYRGVDHNSPKPALEGKFRGIFIEVGHDLEETVVQYFDGLVPRSGIPQTNAHSKAIEQLIQLILAFPASFYQLLKVTFLFDGCSGLGFEVFKPLTNITQGELKWLGEAENYPDPPTKCPIPA